MATSACHWSIAIWLHVEPAPLIVAWLGTSGDDRQRQRRARRRGEDRERSRARACARRSIDVGASGRRAVIRSGRGRSRGCGGRRARRTASRSGPASTMWPGSFSAARKKAHVLRDTLGLLHVVGDDHDRHLSRSSAIVSSMRRVDVGSSAEHGSSISSTSGCTASARAMHSRCCCPPESAPPGVAEPVLDLVPEAGRCRQLLDDRRRVVATVDARELQAGEHVLGDGHRRERVGLLEHHADAAADLGGREAAAVDVDAVEQRSAPPSAAPGTSSCMRLRMRRNVDFPQPDGPMSAVTLRAGISSDTRSSTCGCRTTRSTRRGRERRRRRVGGAGRCAAGPRAVERFVGCGHASPFLARRRRRMRPMWPGPRPPRMRAITNSTSTRAISTSAPVHARWHAVRLSWRNSW